MHRLFAVLVLGAGSFVPFASATEEKSEPAPAIPAPEHPVPTTAPAATCPVCQACPHHAPAPSTVYVADWARLAMLAETDDKVAQMVAEHSRSDATSYAIAEAGIGLGGGLALLGVCEWLIDDDWSRGNSIAVATGLAISALSGLVSWTISPNRDDFYTAINLWNRRHPERPLSP